MVVEILQELKERARKLSSGNNNASQSTARTVRGCGALQIGVERTTTVATTLCTYVATTSNNNGIKDFSGALMC